MFIKYGEENYLERFYRLGEMYFSPCVKFRELEESQVKGIGDKDDGGIRTRNSQCYIAPQNGKAFFVSNAEISFITDCCRFTPTYCIKQTNTAYISEQEFTTLSNQFPKHTHALIIENEDDFLENIRYCFRNKAFAHRMFYQDDMFTDFLEFLFSGDSDILFYKPHTPKYKYFFDLAAQNLDGLIRPLRINKSNAHKTMYRKGLFFKTQQEYRIVLPHLEIGEGTIYNIAPFNAKLIQIKELLR